MIHHLHRFRRWAGVDRAVFFSNAAQMVRMITGPITMALVIRYLTPEIRRATFTPSPWSGSQRRFFWRWVSRRTSCNPPHEYVRVGEKRPPRRGHWRAIWRARSRLISLGRLAFRYYAIAAAIFLVAVGIGGHIFFTLAAQRDPAHHVVAWQGAWWIITAAAAGSFAINPAWSLLEGCNQMAEVARYRLWSSVGIFAANAAALISGAGIYAAAIGAVANLLISASYLGRCWGAFFRQFREHPQHGTVCWRHEIWPFQWRIAVSWMSGYFVFDLINPIAFYFCGAVEAGRLGMSLQLIRMILVISMTWISTKVPKFGMLVAARAWAELDALWRRSTFQMFVMYLLGYGAFLLAVPVVGHWFPKIPERLAPLAVNAWLGGAMVTQVLVGAMSMELRAHKKEPMMWVSVMAAVLSPLLMLLFVRPWGITGEAAGYTLALWAIFIPACKIYQTKRIEYRRHAESQPEALSTAVKPNVIPEGFSHE